jgi:hypothetical protein
MGAAGEAVCALGAAEVVAALAFAMGGATGAAEDGKGLALAAAAAAFVVAAVVSAARGRAVFRADLLRASGIFFIRLQSCERHGNVSTAQYGRHPPSAQIERKGLPTRVPGGTLFFRNNKCRQNAHILSVTKNVPADVLDRKVEEVWRGKMAALARVPLHPRSGELALAAFFGSDLVIGSLSR